MDKQIVLAVPHIVQEKSNYCGVACIKMWADYVYSKNTYTQDIIAEHVRVSPFGAHPLNLANGVVHFTECDAYLFVKSAYEPGAKGDLIAAAIKGVERLYPSIIPYLVSHAVIIRGFKWREDDNQKPIATKVHYNDPYDANGSNLIATPGELDDWFKPSGSQYWIILPWYDLAGEGESGHDAFVMMGGTYYGGPRIYNPKNLNINPNPM